MRTKNILSGAVTAGVAMFFLGWLIYGILLSEFITANCNSGNARPMDDMVWWALIASNLVWGLLLAILIDSFSDYSISSGLKAGAILGLLSALGFDLSMYAMTTMYSSFAVLVVDSLAYSCMFALAGGLAAFVMNKVG